MKHFQAKHIPDDVVLSVISILKRTAYERACLRNPAANLNHFTASRWDIIEAFKPIPWKVVNAKLTSMVRRKLIAGCSGCTCHGSFELVTPDNPSRQ